MVSVTSWLALMAFISSIDHHLCGVNLDITTEKQEVIMGVTPGTSGEEHPKAAPQDLIHEENAKTIEMWPLKQVTFWNTPIQSPVDLITTKAKDMTSDLPLLEIIDHDMEGINATIYNSGSTVYVYINEEPELRPYLIGGPLPWKFVFEQMHFHWGSENIWGSEHFIDGEGFSVEIHMVHYNYKYVQFSTAAREKNGLAVLTLFAEATHDEDDKLLNPLYERLHDITTAGFKTELDSDLAMQWVRSALKTNTEYYAYPGSLTTPPYSENVVFILLPKPILLSKPQLKAFRALHKAHHDNTEDTHFDEAILENKRNLQPLYGRPIIKSSKLR